MLFKPDFAFFRITDIEISFLRNNELNGLILDVDNTLTTHDNPVPAEGVTEWIENMKQNDIKLIIVSNNHPPRVKPFADLLGIDRYKPAIAQRLHRRSVQFRGGRIRIHQPAQRIRLPRRARVRADVRIRRIAIHA